MGPTREETAVAASYKTNVNTISLRVSVSLQQTRKGNLQVLQEGFLSLKFRYLKISCQISPYRLPLQCQLFQRTIMQFPWEIYPMMRRKTSGHAYFLQEHGQSGPSSGSDVQLREDKYPPPGSFILEHLALCNAFWCSRHSTHQLQLWALGTFAKQPLLFQIRHLDFLAAMVKCLKSGERIRQNLVSI